MNSGQYRAETKICELQSVGMDRTVQQKIIVAAATEWAPETVFALEENGDLRFRTDNKSLKAVNQTDLCSTPGMDECIDSFEESAVFRALIASITYRQVEIADSYRDKNGFTSDHDFYKFTSMSNELKNAPATLHRAMNAIIAPVNR